MPYDDFLLLALLVVLLGVVECLRYAYDRWRTTRRAADELTYRADRRSEY